MDSNRKNDDLENLLVFGYQCKIFHDDEKATYIDEGRHLIPWMGDNKLMIDRYDGRGHLYNLHEYDADRIVRSKVQMTEDEMFVEKLCDEERYLELHTDVMEKAMYEEEELKRLREALVEDSYGEVSFSYDQPTDGTNVEGEAVQNQEDDQNEKIEPYYAADELRIPVGMVLPDSAKLGAILEKTAGFVARNGAQMEIVLKTKQKDNPQFNFLSYDSTLNPFYRHVVQMIKMRRYQPKEAPIKVEEPKGEEESASAESAEEVLEEVSSADLMAMIQAKLPSGQIANTPYAALVQRLGKHTTPNEPVKEQSADNKSQGATKTDKKPADVERLKQDMDHWSGSGSPSQLLDAVYDVHSYNASYASQYGDYYGAEVQPPPPGTDVPLPYQQYRQHDAASYVPTTATYGHDAVTYNHDAVTYNHDAVTYGSATATYSRGPVTYGRELVTYGNDAVTHGPAPPAAAAAQFDVHQDDGVNSEMPDVHNPRIVPPPPDQQAVVDRMASYAAKNGTDFEVIVKRKQDPRFDFLYHWHMHNAYYEYKKSLCLRVLEEEARAAKIAAAAAAARALSRATGSSSISSSTSGNSSIGKSVSFSLKSKEAENSSSSKPMKGSSRLNRSSDEEEEELSGDVKRAEEKPTSSSQSTPLVEKSAEELERKQVTERLKDRLAAAARDRMTKEKQLQEDRKRRAAAFVNMLKGSVGTSAPTSTDSESTVASRVKTESVSSARADSRLSDNHRSTDSSSRKHRSRSPSYQSSHGSSRSRSRTPVRKRSRRSRSRDRRPDSSDRNADDRYSSRSQTGHHVDSRQQRRDLDSDRRDARDRRDDTDRHTNGHKSSSSTASKASSSSFHTPHKKPKKFREEEEEEESDHRVRRKSFDSKPLVTSQPAVKASSSSELEDDFSDIRWPLTSAPAVDPKLNKVKAMLKASRKEIFQEDFLPLFKD